MRFLPILALALLFDAPASRAGSKVDWGKVKDTVQKAGELRDELHLGKDNEDKLGREVAAYLIAKFGLYDEEDLTRYVNLVGRTAARRAGRREVDYRFGILNTKGVNAYAAPGGWIFVTKGLLMRLQNEAQLAGVLAHEIVHVDQKHAIKGFVKAKVLGELGKRAGGKTAFDDAVKGLIAGIADKGFPRADEFAADKGALPMLSACGYTPWGLTAALKRLYGDAGAEAGLAEIFESRHPPLPARLKRLDALLRDAPQTGAVLGQRFRRRVTF